MGHTDWVEWVFTGNIDAFYESLRWPGWEAETKTLAGDHGLHIYPPLWADGEPLSSRSRASVAIDELWDLHTKVYPTALNQP